MSTCEQAHHESAFILLLHSGIQTAIRERPRLLSFSLAWTRPKRNDRQAGHASQFSGARFLKSGAHSQHRAIRAMQKAMSSARSCGLTFTRKENNHVDT